MQEAGDQSVPGKVTEQTVKQSIEALQKEIEKMAKPFENMGDAISDLLMESESLTKSFLISKKGLADIMSSVQGVAPEIVKMGGKFSDVGEIIADIAAASRRNVVESKEVIEEVFAVSKLTGEKVGAIVANFTKVGMQTKEIGDNVAKGIGYVQSIGQNARVVMAEVVKNTEQLSRFNFSEGVQGLTKMAAQASLLRFDMKDTFDFADKVLDPDKAIEMASSFQRLGVSVGNLTDPFQLMNQSINDPSGLQTSLIEMTKQFTYFDEDAKQFKISPQGILTMRELSDATGISAAKLRETALAAASLDDRLSAVGQNPFSAGLSEEDQALIANIATMGEGGEYFVEMGGEQKRIADLNSEQLKELVDKTKQQDMTVQEYQAQSLSTADQMAKGVERTNLLLTGLVTGDKRFQKFLAEQTGSLSDLFRESLPAKAQEIGEATKAQTEKTLSILTDPKATGKQKEDALKNVMDELGKSVKDIPGALSGMLKGADIKIPGLDSMIKKITDALDVLNVGGSSPGGKTGKTGATLPGPTPRTPVLPGPSASNIRRLQNEEVLVKGNVDVGGEIKIKVDGGGLTETALTEIFKNSKTDLQQTVTAIVKKGIDNMKTSGTA